MFYSQHFLLIACQGQFNLPSCLLHNGYNQYLKLINLFCLQLHTCHPTNWLWLLAFLLTTDAAWAERVIQLLAIFQEVAELALGIEGEPGAVGVLLAQVETLKLQSV